MPRSHRNRKPRRRRSRPEENRNFDQLEEANEETERGGLYRLAELMVKAVTFCAIMDFWARFMFLTAIRQLFGITNIIVYLSGYGIFFMGLYKKDYGYICMARLSMSLIVLCIIVEGSFIDVDQSDMSFYLGYIALQMLAHNLLISLVMEWRGMVVNF